MAGSSTAGRPRGVERRPFPGTRRIVVGALRAGRHRTPMYGLLDVDVTEARRRLAATEPPGSMTAFVAATAARVAAEHPEVHAYRDWRGRLVTHRRVDVSAMVEAPTAQGPFAIPLTLRDADVRSVADLTAQLRATQADPSASPAVRWAARHGQWVTAVPGLLRAMYGVMGRTTASRRRIGTVGVTSVGMFGDGGGFGIAPLTLMSLELVVGGISERPRVVDGRVVPRDVLDLTLAVDHDVVDGAPAARFAAGLRHGLESAAVLGEELPVAGGDR